MPVRIIDSDRSAVLLQDMATRNRVPIVVGGSGFLLNWLLYGVRTTSPAQRAMQNEIEQDVVTQLARFSGSREEVWTFVLEHYRAELQRSKPSQADSVRLDGLMVGDIRRLVRRLEIIKGGHSLPDQVRSAPLLECPSLKYDFRCVFLSPPRIWNSRRIDYRVEKMISSGLLEEVSQLMHRGLTINMPAASAIGYRQSIQYLENMNFSDEVFYTFLEELSKTTRRYARSQRNWFRTEDIYEFIEVPVCELAIEAAVSPPMLDMPTLVRQQLQKRITTLFGMTTEEYWQHRFSDSTKQSQEEVFFLLLPRFSVVYVCVCVCVCMYVCYICLIFCIG
jgi:tRNA A37 N6-isopentenylltransferase MiaA